MNTCSMFPVGQGRRGDWLQCANCGEETLNLFRDLIDFVCSACGGCAPMVANNLAYHNRSLEKAIL